MSKLDSEFTCEVVEVVEILPHGNADKLEVARFKFADGTIPEYQVVVSKGDYKPGSWGVYISDDSMVPVSRPEFEFLKKRLDYKPYKHCTHLRKMDGPRCDCVDMYRVKAAKIRGVLSTGMLIHVNDITHADGKNWGPGKEVSEQLGVIKYVTPAAQAEADRELATGVERRTGNRLARWWRVFTRGMAVSIPDYSVLSLRKVPNLFDVDELVYVTEKIHGSNIRFGRVDGQPLVGSHHTIKTDNRPWWKRKLWKKRSGSGSYYGKDVFTEWFNRVFASERDINELPNNVVFYGELYGPGIQPMGYTLNNGAPHRVVVFDAWYTKEKRWASKDELDDLLPFTLSRPPQLYFGTVTLDKIKELSRGQTVLGGGCHLREGVVVRSADWSKRGKWVSEDYLAMKDR